MANKKNVAKDIIVEEKNVAGKVAKETKVAPAKKEPAKVEEWRVVEGRNKVINLKEVPENLRKVLKHIVIGEGDDPSKKKLTQVLVHSSNKFVISEVLYAEETETIKGYAVWETKDFEGTELPKDYKFEFQKDVESAKAYVASLLKAN